MQPDNAAMIGLDWGTTSLRGYALRADGSILRRCQSTSGIMQLQGRSFDQVFDEICAELDNEQTLPVLASGMITSRQGWHELPYLPCPAGGQDLAGALVAKSAANGRQVHFVPGLMTRAEGLPDVMRGEETQIIGCDQQNGLFVMPGTHSKWVRIADGAIETFRSFLTGELFAVLKGHSILGRMMADGPFDREAFEQGVNISRSTDLSLGALFSTRSRVLFGELSEAQTGDYLSGLLIGREFKEAIRHSREVTIVGSGALVDRYRFAAKAFGVMTSEAPVDAAALGLHRLARIGGLVG